MHVIFKYHKIQFKILNCFIISSQISGLKKNRAIRKEHRIRILFCIIKQNFREIWWNIRKKKNSELLLSANDSMDMSLIEQDINVSSNSISTISNKFQEKWKKKTWPFFSTKCTFFCPRYMTMWWDCSARRQSCWNYSSCWKY